MVFGTVLSLTTTLSLSCYYNPSSCFNSTNPLHPPPIILYGLQNQTLMLNDMAILPCQATGRIEPQIFWFKDNELLKLKNQENEYSRFRQLPTGTLQISDLKKSDTGVYTCKARNEDGDASWTASLIVEERSNPNVIFQRMPDVVAFPSAPGKPIIINVTEDSVELEWSKPERTGATPIIGYIIQYWSPTTKESWLNVLDVVPNLRFRVKNLNSNRSYVFIVRAENSKGIGLPSTMSDLITTKLSLTEKFAQANSLIDIDSARQKLASGQLIKLQDVKPINATAVILSWRHQRHEPLVQGYYIMWRGPPLSPYPNNSYVNVTNPKAESILISGLKPYTRYEFFMIPYHQSAQGMPSNSLVTTTQEAPPSKPPSDVRFRMLNITSLRVSWRPPPPDAINGVLKGYVINIKGNQSEERNITTNERATSVTLYRLIAEASYTIQVAARTSAGYGPFFNGKPIVMNDETLQEHLRQATEARGFDVWYKRPFNVVIVGLFVWIVFLLIIVLLWYFCCQRRNRKNFETEKDFREFIKIRDGSVVAVGGVPQNGTLARNTFWPDQYNTCNSINGGVPCNHHDSSSNCFANGNNCNVGGSICGLLNNSNCHQHHHVQSHASCDHEICTTCNYGPEGDYGVTAERNSTVPLQSCSQLYYNKNYNLNGSCGTGICASGNCLTLHKNSARSHSPSHHYHYAQLPDIREQYAGNDGFSTFYNQTPGRQYYDDPSPYATTTLVINGATAQNSQSRTNNRIAQLKYLNGTMHHHHHHSLSHGPALPLNPIPKEPPRNFLLNVAVGATEQVDESEKQKFVSNNYCCQHFNNHQNNHASSCGALLDLNSEGAICSNCEQNCTQQRCLIADNQNIQCCAFNYNYQANISHTGRSTSSHLHINNNNITIRNSNQLSKHQTFNTNRSHNHQRSCSVTNTGENWKENCCSNNCFNRKSNDLDANLSSHRQDIKNLNDYSLNRRNSPYTDVSYIHSSDGTNGSSKTGNEVIKILPVGNILDFVPPPPNEQPPGDFNLSNKTNDFEPKIQGNNAVYDAVSEFVANQNALLHQKAMSAELSSKNLINGLKNQKKNDRCASGSISRNDKHNRTKPQPKSRLSLIEKEDFSGDSGRGNSINLKTNKNNGECNPLISHYDFEADGELSEDEVPLVSNINVSSNGLEYCIDEFGEKKTVQNKQSKFINQSNASSGVEKDFEINEFVNDSQTNFITQNNTCTSEKNESYDDNAIFTSSHLNNQLKTKKNLSSVNSNATMHLPDSSNNVPSSKIQA